MQDNDKGITLIEVLASVVILGTIVLVIAQLSGSNLLATQKIDMRYETQLEAENYLVEVRDFLDAAYTPSNLPTEAELRSALEAQFPEQDLDPFTRQVPIVTNISTAPSFDAIPANRVVLETMMTCSTGTGYEPVIIFVIVTWS